MAKVCVTGASGYIASQLVSELLKRGYQVRGTVRSLADPTRVDHLRALPGAERLELFEADLLKDNSFDAAVSGCQGVFHCASPFQLSSTDGRKEFVEPALQGTRNLLGSVDRTPSVTTVVLTSSMASIGFNGGKLPPTHVYSTADWSDIEHMESKNIFYPLSKTLAEKEAWAIAEGKPWKLAVINPTMVFGPLLQPTLNASSEHLLNFCNGSKKLIPKGSLGWVDVRDVAELHVAAFEKKELSVGKRFIAMAASLLWKDVCPEILKLRPSLPVPTEVEEGELATPMLFDNASAVELLGRPFRDPMTVVLPDSLDSLEKAGFLKTQ
eukprot:CAMPEP_0114559732 /NCGR_PEP_ID=MMETSP0114-20121206/11077_1 /TAXON_ID=31324 /ORGANISM="Goniomonas sp, Strain m" /LENGTH=324 /DNA_ID=CAMNT_0001745219 /DNA_START=26 /DNA_END=1000 /DNA_ORIENTATION=-